MRQTQNGEGVAPGTTVTTANSGTGTNTAYTTVTIPAAGTLIYDNSQFAHQTQSIQMATGATSGTCFAAQSFTGVATVWGRFYMYATNFTSTQQVGVRLRGLSAQSARFTVTSGGLILIHNGANTIVATGSVALSAATWYRFEFTCTQGATGTATLNVYILDQITLLDTITVTSAFGTNNIDEFGIGEFTATPNVSAFWFDDTDVNDSGFPGPAQPPMPGTLVRVNKFFGTFMRRRYGELMAPPMDRPSQTVLTLTRRTRLPFGLRSGKSLSPIIIQKAPPFVPFRAGPSRLLQVIPGIRRMTKSSPSVQPEPPVRFLAKTVRKIALQVTTRRIKHSGSVDLSSPGRFRIGNRAIRFGIRPWRGTRQASPPQQVSLQEYRRRNGPHFVSPVQTRISGSAIFVTPLVAPAKTPQPTRFRTRIVAAIRGRGIRSSPVVTSMTRNVNIVIGIPQAKWDFGLGVTVGQYVHATGAPVNFGNPIGKWMLGGGSPVLLSLPSITLEYVRIPVTASSQGLFVNPTTNTVQMAFIVGSSAPQSGDWKTATWDQTAQPTTTYVAQCLVGPGGTITLAVGQYQVWLKLIDLPEIIERPAGVLNIF